MRLRANGLSTVYLKKRSVTKDNEGNDIVSFSSEYKELQMNVQNAGGSIMATIYGERLPYIKACKYQGDDIKEGQNENDGICLYVGKEEDPDFQIKSIQTFSKHSNVTLERI